MRKLALTIYMFAWAVVITLSLIACQSAFF